MTNFKPYSTTLACQGKESVWRTEVMAGLTPFVLVTLLIAWALVSPTNAFSGCFDTANILPVPARSFGDISPGAEFYVEKFTSEQGEDGVYYGTNGGYNFLFIVSPTAGEGVAVFDAPPSGSWTLHAVQNTTSKPITRFIYAIIIRIT